uniref:Uncharacterized protein n=1 Tax=Odontella aurita TaxID=265563 RepID=A0A7S4IBS1_9STRA
MSLGTTGWIVRSGGVVPQSRIDVLDGSDEDEKIAGRADSHHRGHGFTGYLVSVSSLAEYQISVRNRFWYRVREWSWCHCDGGPVGSVGNLPRFSPPIFILPPMSSQITNIVIENG